MSINLFSQHCTVFVEGKRSPSELGPGAMPGLRQEQCLCLVTAGPSHHHEGQQHVPRQ